MFPWKTREFSSDSKLLSGSVTIIINNGYNKIVGGT